jgi:hypothetical protein
MPYCGRCLNVGRAGKRGAPPEYGTVQPRQRCATSSGPTDSEPGQHRFCGKASRSSTSYRSGSPLDRKRTQSARFKAPSRGIGGRSGYASPGLWLALFMKTFQAGRRRAPPW